MTSLVKIGEGVYGEVFKYEAEDGDVSIIKVLHIYLSKLNYIIMWLP